MKNNINSKLINRRRALGIIGVASVGGGIFSLNKYKEHVNFEPLEWKGYALGAPARIVIHHPERKEAESAL